MFKVFLNVCFSKLFIYAFAFFDFYYNRKIKDCQLILRKKVLINTMYMFTVKISIMFFFHPNLFSNQVRTSNIESYSCLTLSNLISKFYVFYLETRKYKEVPSHFPSYVRQLFFLKRVFYTFISIPTHNIRVRTLIFTTAPSLNAP